MITTRNAVTPVQKAIVARLKGSAELTAKLAGRQAVFDQPPESEGFPYIVVGDHLSTPNHDHTSQGREITETLHVWTKERSSKPGQDIADVVTALLDHQDRALSDLLATDGHRCIMIRQEYDQALKDPDPQIRHHVLRFRIQTQQTS